MRLHGRRITPKWGNLRICDEMKKKRETCFLFLIFSNGAKCIFNFGRSMLYYMQGSFRLEKRVILYLKVLLMCNGEISSHLKIVK